MKCAFGCSISRAIGVAKVQGRGGLVPESEKNDYALCFYHYSELIDGKWKSVNLIGWEPFPTEEKKENV